MQLKYRKFSFIMTDGFLAGFVSFMQLFNLICQLMDTNNDVA